MMERQMTQANTTDAMGQKMPVGGGTVTGAPLWILRGEGFVLFGAAVAAYAYGGLGWALFAVLFLVPDIFMLGYLIDRARGAALYNLGHSTAVPAVVIGVGLLLSSDLTLGVGLIWLAHVGFDRAMGYGLKYGDSFTSTHLSRAAVRTTKAGVTPSVA